MKHLDINERKQFISLLVHHMMYSDDKYAHVLTLLDRWESETPTKGFDFSYQDIPKRQGDRFTTHKPIDRILNKRVARNKKL
jgi:hypothetical protein